MTSRNRGYKYDAVRCLQLSIWATIIVCTADTYSCLCVCVSVYVVLCKIVVINFL